MQDTERKELFLKTSDILVGKEKASSDERRDAAKSILRALTAIELSERAATKQYNQLLLTGANLSGKPVVPQSLGFKEVETIQMRLFDDKATPRSYEKVLGHNRKLGLTRVTDKVWLVSGIEDGLIFVRDLYELVLEIYKLTGVQLHHDLGG